MWLLDILQECMVQYPWVIDVLGKVVSTIPETTWHGILFILPIVFLLSFGRYVGTVITAFFAQYDFDVVNESSSPINVAGCVNGYWSHAFVGSSGTTVRPGEVYHGNLRGILIFKLKACYILVQKSDDNKEIVIPVHNADIKGSRAFAVRDDGVHELESKFCNTWHPIYDGINRW
jgi:hypothetical protein